MIVKLKKPNTRYRDLTSGQLYDVIGIEANEFRIINNAGRPFLYSPELFSLVDAREPADWVTEFGDYEERYSYPPPLNRPGFFEDFFDQKAKAVATFWQVVNHEYRIEANSAKEAKQSHMNTSERLLFQNRRRCSICRDPEKPVEIYPIDKSKSTQAVENLVLLCEDCYERASECKQEFGREYLCKELARFKQIWEHECEGWRDGPDYILRIRQGDAIEDIQSDEYNKDGALVGWYGLHCGGSLHIEMRSDEFVKIDIRKERLYSEQYGHRSYFSHSAYEFDLEFTARRSGMYALLIQNRSSEKATVDLTVTWTTTQELIDWSSLERTQELESVSGDTNIKYIPWKILPPGEHPFPQIMKYYENLQAQNQNSRYEPERLRQISILKPTKVTLGKDEFEGYVMFCFEESNFAILDCPIVGNAIYVLRGDWERLSRLSKKDLLRNHSLDVTRIVHSGNWFFRLRRSISARRSA